MSIKTYDLNKTRYTRRDYNSIKEDLTNAIPYLTQEWTSREESDPGIVLIKLMAMFGDTLSYNVDKIALELYIQSVTQRKNCAKILSLLGYKMHWYRSARVTAHIRLAKSLDSDMNAIHVLLTPYETQLVAGDIPYTVVQQGIGQDQIDISSATRAEEVNLIQGTPVTVNFTSNDLINNNRYYLGSYKVDETELKLVLRNGRQVKCQLVDNLYLVTQSSVIHFEFNIDEYDRPYIQLEDGWETIASSDTAAEFSLTYIVSAGSAGNISSNAFTAITGMDSNSRNVTSITNLVITNLPNNTKYGINGQDLDTYNSPGLDPQTADDARFDSANYVFTHDTLITSADYERAAKRTDHITVSKLVDAQVVLNDDLKLDGTEGSITKRALDGFEDYIVIEETEEGEDPEKYLSPYYVILYLAYKNFDVNNNFYCTKAAQKPDADWSMFGQDDPYGYKWENEIADAGYYPYKASSNILQSIRDSLSNLNTLNVKIEFGTLKVFPFKVKGTLHLIEPLSPSASLLVIKSVNDALTQAYYPDLHPIGEKPNFIELVDIIQASDPHIKYFDAIDNIVEWAPNINTTDSSETTYIDEQFDTTSAIMYNGLSSSFNLSPKFLKFRLKNAGVVPDSEDTNFYSAHIVTFADGTTGVVGNEGDPSLNLPADYGTAYLFNLSRVQRRDRILKINENTIETLQLNNLEELQALVEDMAYKGLWVHTDTFYTISGDTTEYSSEEFREYLLEQLGLIDEGQSLDDLIALYIEEYPGTEISLEEKTVSTLINNTGLFWMN